MTGLLRERPRAAVVGGGLGGLVAAGILARHGSVVTLFEAEPAVGGKAGTIDDGGVRLDVGPTLLAMPHLVRETFAALDATDLVPRIDELSLQCAYRFADGRTFDAHRDLAASAVSAARLDPREGAALEAFYREAERIWRVAGEPYLEAPFEGMLDFVRRVARRGVGAVTSALRMGTLADVAARHFRTAAMRQFAGRFATYAGASPYAVSGAYALVPWVEHAYGVHHVRGGMGALVAALEAAVRRLGVTIHIGTRVGWRPRGAGFGVGSGRDAEWFDTVVVNADPSAGTPAPLTLSGYVLLLDVPERLALPHHTVLFARDYPAEFAALFAGRVPDDATVYVCHPAATDPGMAPPGRSGLYVMMNLPPLAHGADAWERVAARVRAACLARLETLVPGVARRARVVGERTPLDLARLGAPGGAIYGVLPQGLLGPFRRPRMRGTPRGLFWAGGGTHPGGGVPLVMLSGRFAAGMALEHVGVRKAA